MSAKCNIALLISSFLLLVCRLKTKLSELRSRHEKQIHRPALDDTTEQHHIQRLTNEITRHFTHAHTHITAIKSQIRHGNKKNLVSYFIARKLAIHLIIRNEFPIIPWIEGAGSIVWQSGKKNFKVIPGFITSV